MQNRRQEDPEAASEHRIVRQEIALLKEIYAKIQPAWQEKIETFPMGLKLPERPLKIDPVETENRPMADGRVNE